MTEHDENRRQPSPENPMDAESQQNAIGKRGLATHVEGQGTTSAGNTRSNVEGEAEQGTKRPGHDPQGA